MTCAVPILLNVFTALVMLFLMAPMVTVVLGSLNAGDVLTFPPQGDVFRRAILFSPTLAAAATCSKQPAHSVVDEDEDGPQEADEGDHAPEEGDGGVGGDGGHGAEVGNQ